MKKTKAMATCGILTALSVVLMLVGHVIGIGIYAAPMLAGICLLPIGKNYGMKYKIAVWMAASALSFILIPNVEENLMYLCVFGLYPVIYGYFGKLNKALRILLKLLYFNVVFAAIEMLMILVIAPEATDAALIVTLLLCGNIMFIIYDLLLPRMEYVLKKYLGKIIKF